MFLEYMARRRHENGEVVLVHVQQWDSRGPLPKAWLFRRNAQDEEAHLTGLVVIDESESIIEEPHELIQAYA